MAGEVNKTNIADVSAKNILKDMSFCGLSKQGVRSLQPYFQQGISREPYDQVVNSVEAANRKEAAGVTAKFLLQQEALGRKPENVKDKELAQHLLKHAYDHGIYVPVSLDAVPVKYLLFPEKVRPEFEKEKMIGDHAYNHLRQNIELLDGKNQLHDDKSCQSRSEKNDVKPDSPISKDNSEHLSIWQDILTNPGYQAGSQKNTLGHTA